MQLQIYTFANHCNASVIILHFAPIYRSHDEKAESQHKWFEISFNCQKRNSAKNYSSNLAHSLWENVTN